MSKTRKCIRNDNGFTLVELMVTVLLTAIAVVSIYRGYTAFSRSADAQQQVMEMQQNLRIGMFTLASDIRRAGINEEEKTAAGFRYDFDPGATPPIIDVCSNDLHDSDPSKLVFRAIAISMDLTGADDGQSDGLDNDGDGFIDESGEMDNRDNDDDGELNEEDELRIGDNDVDDDGERIRYSLEVTDDTYNLRRGVWKAGTYDTYTLITNVEALNFVYFDDAGTELVPSEEIDPGVFVLSAGDAAEVDRVEITMVVRATNEDYRYTDTDPYLNLQGATVYDPVTDAVPPYADPDTGYVIDGRRVRRRVATMSVQIRNNL